MTQVDVDPPSKQQLLKTSGIAAGIAVLMLFVAVLPAEYGIDPLRTGQLLGLTNDGFGSVDAHHVANDPIVEYTVTIELPAKAADAEAGTWTEAGLKVWLDEGESVLYQWTASGNITYDLHTDQGGSYRGGAGIGTGAEGFLTAPVSAYHGFAVRNDGAEPVTFTLRFVGEFDPDVDLYSPG